MPDVNAALADDRAAVDELAAAAPRTGAACTTPRAPGKWSPAQIVEHLARADLYLFTSPPAGIWGSKVMIINEMAGSGGDLMPYMFCAREIGPLVGKRTWGGLVHTADTPPFVDGGSAIVPRGGFFTKDGKWAVENEGRSFGEIVKCCGSAA